MKSSLRVLMFTPVALLGADFVNLTFDEPDLSGPLVPAYPGGPLRGSVAQLLRGWTVQANGQPVDTMSFSPVPPGVGGVDFVNLQQTRPGESPLFGFAYLNLDSPPPIEFPPTPIGPEIRLSQTGTIPADTAGLWIGSAGYVQMFVNGQKIDDPRIGTFGNVVVDMQKFAGQAVNLEFLVRPGDSIRFDIFGFVSIPEPQTWALAGVGLGAVLWWGRRKQ